MTVQFFKDLSSDVISIGKNPDRNNLHINNLTKSVALRAIGCVSAICAVPLLNKTFFALITLNPISSTIFLTASIFALVVAYDLIQIGCNLRTFSLNSAKAEDGSLTAAAGLLWAAGKAKYNGVHPLLQNTFLAIPQKFLENLADELFSRQS
ncbi:MAG: hypothetical protein K1060chlam5_00685 [Candidatus Anoxychlamydiales bacterium]|nr:hypothetical protein [Candidatus Anoxychlamydiales bacterium]